PVPKSGADPLTSLARARPPRQTRKTPVAGLVYWPAVAGAGAVAVLIVGGLTIACLIGGHKPAGQGELPKPIAEHRLDPPDSNPFAPPPLTSPVLPLTVLPQGGQPQPQPGSAGVADGNVAPPAEPSKSTATVGTMKAVATAFKHRDTLSPEDLRK